MAAYDGHLLWVVDVTGNRVFAVTGDGDVLFSGGPLLPGSDLSLDGPVDIALLGNDRLVISDSGNNRLVVCRIIYDE